MKASTTAAPALPQSKRDKIVYLLDHWDEIFDPTVTAAKQNDDVGSGVALMPMMSRHPSVVELDRCLSLLRFHAPIQSWHLMSYYRAEWRIRIDKIRKKRAGGKFETQEVRRRERVFPREVRLEKVRRAEEFLTAAFRGEVFIPGELWDALTKPIAA